MSTSTIVLNGRTYLVDLGSALYKRRTIPLLRSQSDQGSRPGEQSVNPEGAWRRSQSSWHHGAGQTFYDRDTSDPLRFDTSRNIDPWDPFRLKLLPKARQVYDVSVTSILTVGARVFVTTATALRYSDDVLYSATPTWTAVATPAGGWSSLTTNGTDVWAILSTGPNTFVYAVPNAGTVTPPVAAVHATPADPDLVWYARGRLLAAFDLVLRDITVAGAPVVVYTLPTGRWSAVTSGTRHIYAGTVAGTNGGIRSVVYRIAVNAAGTGLDVPIVAATLPNCEGAFGLYGYLGFVLIGTRLGVRLAAENDDGSLTLGSLTGAVEADVSGVEHFAARGRFVWYGENPETDTGLHRLDLSQFVAPLTPANATDLKVVNAAPGANGLVSGIDDYTGTNIIFGVEQGSGAGVYLEDLLAPSGTATFTTGLIDYGIADRKMPLFIDLHTQLLPPGSAIAVWVAWDGGDDFVFVGTHNDSQTHSSHPIETLIPTSDSFAIKLIFAGPVPNTGFPEVNRLTLRAYPVSSRGEIIELPLIFSERLVIDGAEQQFDVSAELANIRALVSTNDLVTLVEPSLTSSVYVEDYTYSVTHFADNDLSTQGTCVVRLKSFS